MPSGTRAVPSGSRVPKLDTAQYMEIGDPERFRILSPDGRILWQAQAGMQNDLFILSAAGADEILLGGLRGPGKSSALIAWMAEPIANPQYRGVFLRFQAEALKEFIDKAYILYRDMGAVIKNRPPEFHFPTGAILYTAHLKDDRSFEDLRGHEYHRIGVEEGAQIRTRELYLKVLGSNRSTVPGISRKICITSNPDGPGNKWLKDRFIKVYSAGKLIPPKTAFLDPIEKRVRVYIPGRRDENLILLEAEPNYYDQFAHLPEHIRRAWVDGDWDAPACFDSETELLTDTGFRNVLEIETGDRVATLSPAGELEFRPCSSVIKQQYSGPMVKYETPQVNFIVTPNHRMYCESDIGRAPKKAYRFVDAASLPRASIHPRTCEAWQGDEIESVTISGTHNTKRNTLEDRTCPVCGTNYQAESDRLRHRRKTTCSRKCSYTYRRSVYGKVKGTPKPLHNGTPATFHAKYPAGDYLEFLGWFLSDGNVVYRIQKGGRVPSGVVIAQYQSVNAAKCERIARLLGRLGIHYNRAKDRFTICSVLLARHLAPLGGSGEKYIPREFMGLSRPLLQRLMDGLLLGDGTRLANGAWSYSSTSKRLADDVQEVSVKLGLACSISLRPPKSAAHALAYILRISKPGRTAVRVFRRKIQVVEYSGFVGCVDVGPNHTILCRRRGKLLWTGNSSFFPEFRPLGPLMQADGTMEPPEACHAVPAKAIPAWCHRWLSLDWGFGHHSAAYWAARNTDKRVHVYREYVVRKVGSDVLGAEIAKLSVRDLEELPDHHMTMYLSHDAFAARDRGKTIAEQIQFGIQTILGPGSCFVLALTEDERAMKDKDPDAALQAMMLRREQLGGKVAITIRRCNPDRPSGWSYMRTMFRWRALADPVNPDMQYAMQLLNGPFGHEKYAAYMDMFRKQQPEVLPGVVIHKESCPVLLDTIPRLVIDPDKPDDVSKFDSTDDEVGDDPADSFRFLLMGYQEYESRVPMSIWMEQEVEKYLPPGCTDINIKIQVAQQALRRYQAQNPQRQVISFERDSMALRG